MFLRKQGFLAEAFEQTYQRSIAESAQHPSATISSALSGLLGWQYKYYPAGSIAETDATGKTIAKDAVSRYKDRNIYNWIEQFVFLPARVAKNVTKLFTEFMWNAAASGLVQAGNYLHQLGDNNFHDARDPKLSDYLKYWLSHTTAYALKGASYLPWLVAKVGQSITSPFTAARETASFVQAKTGSKLLAGLAAGLRFSFTMASYAIIAGFALPVLAPALGSQVAGAFATVMNALSSAPVIGPVLSTIGSGFMTGLSAVASFVGLSIPSAAVASAGVIAGTALVATPVLSLLKAGLRRISPFKASPEAPYATASIAPIGNSAIHSSLVDAAPASDLSTAPANNLSVAPASDLSVAPASDPSVEPASTATSLEVKAQAPQQSKASSFAATISAPFNSIASLFRGNNNTAAANNALLSAANKSMEQEMADEPVASWGPCM